MRRSIKLLLTIFIFNVSYGQRTETVYLNEKDSTSNMYIAVFPKNEIVKSFMVLLDGFGNSPNSVLSQTEIPKFASKNGILTIMPVLKTGSTYWGSDKASQESLKEVIQLVVSKYQLKDKDFYIGGFGIGGTCAVKYSELAVQENYEIKPKAIFAINPILDWERYYNGAKRVIRLSDTTKVNDEIFYMISRIEKEMDGTTETALKNYHSQSPYSFSDTTQKAIKNLIEIPIMIISEPDIQWYLKERNYDLSYSNIIDQVAMINELQRLGNKNAILITTSNKGYRMPNKVRHPNSWSIADPKQIIKWIKNLDNKASR
ncbi:hypothetical protein Q361_1308 [Flavobacterium croceum DSM 17960]|uniref:Alpha/beta hydrolase n=1 Tax=Flavobacterium croceum DSM 17960 TaxID=1121886 RepID=A0A2S4N4S9_9FLAO|nr:alpha/beta hydrolase [Flavobacterium croceum]POS00695.1 hypothetical protein Q361_1308 [Flavobacterium croceum DSM 17960]